ncbi:hypothetical protein [Marinimicrobium alkaliphilum]|uniref:hypothetical protein n=1 Tax=Marinimicrobium alkaliphilum TaxID=2202654 RepID=UPI001300B304|nr:hypothetical protein [Marinimicrobium alkaliphilum]
MDLSQTGIKVLLLSILLLFSGLQDLHAQDSGTIQGDMSFGKAIGHSGNVQLRANYAEGSGNYIGFEISDSPEFEISYNTWTLLGEPVWSFVAKYKLPNGIYVYRDDRRVLEILSPTDSRSIEAHRNGQDSHLYTVTVPSEVYEKIRVTSFRFSANIGRYIISRQNPGITGAHGEWGWDVPGSPTWDKMFLAPWTNDYYTSDIPEQAWLSGEEAREVYIEHRGKENVLRPRGLWDVKMDLWPVIREIRRVTPEALEHYYSRPRDSQALAMVSALERSDQPRDSRAYREQVQTVKSALQRLGSDVSPELIDHLDSLGAGADRNRLSSDVRQVGNMVQAVISNTPSDQAPDWREALKTRIQQLSELADVAGLQANDPIRSQITNLQDVVMGLGSGRMIWIVATGSSRVETPLRSAGIVFGTSSSTEEQRRRAQQRSNERRAEEQRRRAELDDRRNTELRRGWVRSEMLRVWVPDDVAFSETTQGLELPLLESWAREEFGGHVIERDDWRTVSRFKVHVFEGAEEARALIRELDDYRPVDVKPPTREHFPKH